MAFPVAAAGIMAGGQLLGGFMGGKGAKSAAQTQSDAANRASQMQWDMYQQQREDQMPFRQAGMSAMFGTGGLYRLKPGMNGQKSAADRDSFIRKYESEYLPQMDQAGKMGFVPGNPYSGLSPEKLAAEKSRLRAKAESAWQGTNQNDYGQYEVDPELTRKFGADDLVKDPGYDFRMKEGQKALERSASARGSLMSGGTLKGLERYSQDYASGEYTNAYNRFNNDQSNRFNRLSALAGGGQVANQQMGNAGMNYANNAGANMIGAANAQGAAQIANAGAWGDALSGIGKTVGQGWMSQWSDQQGAGQITANNPYGNPYNRKGY